jgi:hypothetical protein
VKGGSSKEKTKYADRKDINVGLKDVPELLVTKCYLNLKTVTFIEHKLINSLFD